MLDSKIKICGFADEADPMLDGQIEALRENGISLLEIRGVNRKSIGDYTIDEAKAVKKKLDANGISVWSVGSPYGKTQINESFDNEIEKFKQTLEVGALLGAPCMRIFSFYGTDSKQEYFGEVCDRVGTLADMCKPYGIIPCHENEKGIFGENAASCLALHKAIPSLKAVFDPANFVQSGQEALEAWNMLEDYVHYIHIKDANESHANVPAGCGVGKIPEILPRFVANGGGVLTLEPHLQRFVGLESLEQEGARSDVGSCKFKNNREAFTYATNTLKSLLSDLGI